MHLRRQAGWVCWCHWAGLSWRKKAAPCNQRYSVDVHEDVILFMNIYEYLWDVSRDLQDQGHDSGWFWCFFSRGNKMLDFLFRKHWSSDWWPWAFWKHRKRTVRMCENMHSEGFQSLLENVLSPLSQSVTFVTALGLERDQNRSSHLTTELVRLEFFRVFP